MKQTNDSNKAVEGITNAFLIIFVIIAAFISAIFGLAKKS